MRVVRAHGLRGLQNGQRFSPRRELQFLAQITPRNEAQELQFGLIGSMNAAAKTAAMLIRSAVASVLYRQGHPALTKESICYDKNGRDCTCVWRISLSQVSPTCSHREGSSTTPVFPLR
jgi:hypothetical protein